MTERDTDKYVTAERAATTLGVSERTIYRYAETGQLRTRKSGRRTMFPMTLTALHQICRPSDKAQIDEVARQAGY